MRVPMGLPPHFLDPSDCASWLSDSVVRGPVYHRTRTANLQSILRVGLSVAYSQYGDCQAVYFSVNPWRRIRTDAVQLTAAVRLRNPVRVKEQADLPEVVGLERGAANPAEVRRRLLEAGYDGAITEWGSTGFDEANQVVVALRDEDIRLFEEYERVGPAMPAH